MQAQTAGLMQIMSEAFTGHRIVKAYNLENSSLADFATPRARRSANICASSAPTKFPGRSLIFWEPCGVALALLYLIYLTQARPSTSDFVQVI